jgi:hypothetical protein
MLRAAQALIFYIIYAPYSHELPQNKLCNINGLRFYHEIRWNLKPRSLWRLFRPEGPFPGGW